MSPKELLKSHIEDMKVRELHHRRLMEDEGVKVDTIHRERILLEDFVDELDQEESKRQKHMLGLVRQ